MALAARPGPEAALDHTVTIDRRYCGPSDSAQGGYACGLVATALGAGAAEATLRRPPPLGRPLRLAVADRRATLHDGGHLVAEATTLVQPDFPPPPLVSFETAERAASRFDVEPYERSHYYPDCFVCGPHRRPGDGLRIFPGDAGEHVVVWPWVPDASLSAPNGLIEPALLWAVLDCPSGLAWYHGGLPADPHVLGRMAAAVHRRPAPGERLVAAGWVIGEEGRKRYARSAIWTDSGEVVAENLSTWIVLTEQQRATFRPAGSA